MNWRDEWKPLALLAGVFLASFYLPIGQPRFDHAINEGLYLLKWYAQEHVLLCLIPAFFIAGAITVFISQDAVVRHLGSRAKQWLAYTIASTSGTILAVCSCTVLPLFSSIHKRGAGLGPAIAFLYSGPAINILAIILTARVLGVELGVARAVGAVVFSVVIGLLMAVIFREKRTESELVLAPVAAGGTPLWQSGIHMAFLVAILIFANWGDSSGSLELWNLVFRLKWWLTGLSALGLAWILHKWFGHSWQKMALAISAPIVLAVAMPTMPLLSFGAGILGLSFLTSTGNGESRSWFESSWGYAKQILPLLFAGVVVAGFLLGRPGEEGLIPSSWIAASVGGNSPGANFFASIAGAIMYFATLTEVPILQGLIGSGMGKGPALALLLAGPALSLPSMLVIANVIGVKKTAVYLSLVIVMATMSGMIYGALFGS